MKMMVMMMKMIIILFIMDDEGDWFMIRMDGLIDDDW